MGMIKLTGLWKHEDKNGQIYYSGNLGSGRILIYKNSYKEEDKHPDLVMYIAEIEKKEDGDDGVSR